MEIIFDKEYLDYTMRQTASEPSFAARLKKIRQYVAAL